MGQKAQSTALGDVLTVKDTSSDWQVVFSTDGLPECDRVSAFNAGFGDFIGARFHQIEGRDFHATASIRTVGDLIVGKVESSELRFDNSPTMERGGEPFVILNAPQSLTIEFNQRGTTLVANTGDITVSRGDEHCGAQVTGGVSYGAKLPKSAITALLERDADLLPTLLRHNEPATRLLTGYLESLMRAGAIEDPFMGSVITRHVCDLIAWGLGPSRDGEEIVAQRGVRAARLRMIKDFIRAHLTSVDLSVQTAALESGVSPRYVQMLFEAEGSTFSEFVLGERLEFAYSLLQHHTSAGSRIADVALQVGFSDVSYFNRVFRRRFGMTPSEARVSGSPMKS